MIPALPGDIFREGQVLNNTWTIEGVLGRGGTGEVYRARSLVTGRVVAIKALAAQYSGDEGYLELMRREEAMRDIVHDAVVRYSDCSRSAEGHVFLVMDYIDGPALSEVMAERRLEPRELLILAHRVAEALGAAHARGIVHRDLSPDNIILRDGRVEGATVIDFGIAKDTAAGARTIIGNQFAGKYEYAAPEQFEGKAVPASDLYALGAMLAAAARGAVPYAGATPGEIIRRKAEPLDLRDLPEPLSGLIHWLTAPRLPERAPSAAAVIARLDALLKDRPSAAARRAPPGGKAPASGAPPRRFGGRALLVAGLVVALLAAGWWFWRGSSPTLPLVEEWRLHAETGPPPRLEGNAPDSEAATRIAAAFSAASGADAGPGTLTLARGMPVPGWAAAIAGLFPLLDDLSSWTVAVIATQVEIAGTPRASADIAALTVRLEDWAQSAGLGLDLRLTPEPVLPEPEVAAIPARPEPAPAPVPVPIPEATPPVSAGPTPPEPQPAKPDIAALLKRHATCGALTVDPPDPGTMPGATVTVQGSLPVEAARAALAEDLHGALGDREIRLGIEVLNPTLCLIRAAMDGLPDGGVTIRLSEAKDDTPSLTGIFHPGDNPLADVLIPPALAASPDAELWVAAAQEGKVANIMPNASDENRLDRIGSPDGPLHVVRVLWPVEGRTAGQIALRVNDKDFGKTAIFAIVSRGPLFPERRPPEESPASFVQAITELRQTAPDRILAVSERVMDLRP
ncbi:MAG TPA: protein kinase [Paracoccus sp. (in: a-proteobacteria)]|uniref:serine/threonine-protein kinase n=1 Tax=Paracoccus sp. TaxID=267 RepID=UPI002C219433|nr:protein kinase [Paracoccus sp. (in: a-proteobacteria)]HWL56737.1 protein kinase [Paracoccus sp. (in: a-proteobacteria)]